MEKTQTQAWLDRAALKGVSPGRAKKECAWLSGHMGQGILAWEGIHGSVSQGKGNIYDTSSRGSVWFLLLI